MLNVSPLVGILHAEDETRMGADAMGLEFRSGHINSSCDESSTPIAHSCTQGRSNTPQSDLTLAGVCQHQSFGHDLGHASEDAIRTCMKAPDEDQQRGHIT